MLMNAKRTHVTTFVAILWAAMFAYAEASGAWDRMVTVVKSLRAYLTAEMEEDATKVAASASQGFTDACANWVI
jgi:hypothetical protein